MQRILTVIAVILFSAAHAVAQMRLEQAPPRRPGKPDLPKPFRIGPVIPGLRQGAVPQGLAYWPERNWLLVSYYLDAEVPSVVAVIDRTSGAIVRSLSLLEANGDSHQGHVGGLAVSRDYLWIGSGKVYRVPLEEIADAEPVAYLTLRDSFRAAAIASFVACDERRLWVGEFVLNKKSKASLPHHAVDRDGVHKYAWACAYELDMLNEQAPAAGDEPLIPAAVYSIRQKAQGMAFLHGHAILSVSYGRANRSTIASYRNPLDHEGKLPHQSVQIRGESVPLWYLDRRNATGETSYPAMAEGIVAVDDWLAVLTESGAAKYQSGGLGPLDAIVYISPASR